MVRPTPRAFPSIALDSGSYRFRPHSQRRDREGLSPSSLTRKSQSGGTLGECDKSCQVHLCAAELQQSDACSDFIY